MDYEKGARDDLSQTQGQDLSYFMPATPVRSTLEQMRYAEMREEVSMIERGGTHTMGEVSIDYQATLNFPSHLRLHTAPRGDVCSLPKVTLDQTGQYSKYGG